MNKQKILTAFKFAFPKTLPILTGFMFLGLSFGIYMNACGFNFLYPMLMSITIFGGSLEFVAVPVLMSSFAPLDTFLLTLMIHARHLFYGISMLDKLKGTGWKKPFIIFGMCDETFSIIYSTDVPDNVDKGWFMFFVEMLDHLYWIVGSTIGGIAGSFIPFKTTGIDFVMTAMFVVIFLDNWLKEDQHISSLIGVLASLVCLWVFGAQSFLVPTMIAIVCLLTVFRAKINHMTSEEARK